MKKSDYSDNYKSSNEDIYFEKEVLKRIKKGQRKEKRKKIKT